MPTHPLITIRTTPATPKTPAALKAFLPDGTELPNVQSITIHSQADGIIIATIVTASISIDPITIPAIVKDGTLTNVCQQVSTTLKWIATYCKGKCTDRKQKHIHGPAALYAAHYAKELDGLQATLSQADTTEPTKPQQPSGSGPSPAAH